MGDLTICSFDCGDAGAAAATGAAGAVSATATGAAEAGASIVRRMRTRSPPRSSSSSAMPLSTTSWISSLISSLDIIRYSTSKDSQLFGCRRKDFAAGFGHKHGIFDTNSSEITDICAGLDGDGHTGREPGFVAAAQARSLMNFEAQAVTGRMDKLFS